METWYTLNFRTSNLIYIHQKSEKSSNILASFFHRAIFPILAPWFTRRPSRLVYARLGDGLVINCNADGVPKPTIIISKIRPNKFQMKGNKIANIKASHLGIYECKASNKYGVIKYPFLIKIRGKLSITNDSF